MSSRPVKPFNDFRYQFEEGRNPFRVPSGNAATSRRFASRSTATSQEDHIVEDPYEAATRAGPSNLSAARTAQEAMTLEERHPNATIIPDENTMEDTVVAVQEEGNDTFRRRLRQIQPFRALRDLTWQRLFGTGVAIVIIVVAAVTIFWGSYHPEKNQDYAEPLSSASTPSATGANIFWHKIEEALEDLVGKLSSASTPAATGANIFWHGIEEFEG